MTQNAKPLSRVVCTKETPTSLISRLIPSVAITLILLVMLMIFPRVLALRAQKRTHQRANDTMAGLVAQEATAETARDGAHEAALAFLRVIGVGGVARVAVGVGGVAAGGCTLAPGLLLLLVVVVLAVLLGLLAVVEAALLWGPAVAALLLVLVVALAVGGGGGCAVACEGNSVSLWNGVK